MSIRPPRSDWAAPVATPIGANKLFDITVTSIVGSVFDGGIESPRTVAFQMIAEFPINHAGPSTFEFPNEDGTITRVVTSTFDPTR